MISSTWQKCDVLVVRVLSRQVSRKMRLHPEEDTLRIKKMSR